MSFGGGSAIPVGLISPSGPRPPVLADTTLPFDVTPPPPLTVGATVGPVNNTGGALTNATITGGNTANNYAISTTGVILVGLNGPANLTHTGTDVLTVIGSNGVGNSGPVTVTVNRLQAPILPATSTMQATVGVAPPTTIGTVSNTGGVPTTEVLTGTNSGNYAITTGGVVTTTVAPAAAGTDNLTATATNASGTSSSALTITRVAAGVAPIITDKTFDLSIIPPTGYVGWGTVQSSQGTNISYVITQENGGAPTGRYDIGLQTGILTITATGHSQLTTEGSDILIVTATNSQGSDSSSNTIRKWLDGYQNRPVGVAAQYPTFLNGLCRPPWKVAGVDYGVGYGTLAGAGNLLVDASANQLVDAAGNLLVDAASGAFNIPGVTTPPAGVTVNTTAHTFTVTGANVVVDSWDFSVGGGWNVFVTGAGCTVQNCNFKVGANLLDPIGMHGLNGLLQYCVIDGNSLLTTDPFGPGGPTCVDASLTNTIKYCWIKNGIWDLIDLHGTGTTTDYTMRFNLLDNGARSTDPQAHSDWVQTYSQFSGDAGYGTITVEYNTNRQLPPVGGGGGTQGWTLNMNSNVPVGTGIGNINFNNNTSVDQSNAMNYYMAYDLSGTRGVVSINNNYALVPENLGTIAFKETDGGGPDNGTVTGSGNTKISGAACSTPANWNFGAVQPPILAIQNFNLPLPATASQAIGTLNFTGGTPQSWSITVAPASAQAFFEIITNANGTGALRVASTYTTGITAQTYQMTIHANNGGGASNNVTDPVVASQAAPVVTAKTVPMQLPVTARTTPDTGTLVLQGVATNSPTAASWALSNFVPAGAATWFGVETTSGTPGRVYVTSAGVTGLDNTTQTITFRLSASNAGGTGFATQTVNVLAQASSIFPLKRSANNRYVTTQANVPFFLIGDSPQAMMVAVSTADADIFNANRQAAGYNALLVDLIATVYTGGRPDSTTFDGIAPFLTSLGTFPSQLNNVTTTAWDVTTPNPAYWSRVDTMINQMVNRGFVIFADPMETGGYLGNVGGPPPFGGGGGTPTGGMFAANGTTKIQQYGTFLGNRYKGIPNIVWFHGNDWLSWQTDSTTNTLVKALADAIIAADPQALTTLLLWSSSGVAMDSFNNPLWNPIITMNAVYSYLPPYVQSSISYARNAAAPVFLGEANYEFENNVNPTPTNALILRHTNWWSILYGCTTGIFYGNHFTWDFNPAWKTNINTPGSAQVTILKNFFAALNWQLLVPDTNTNHALVTAGFGTYNTTATDLTNIDYVTAALASDGSFGVAYIPTGGAARNITVNMTKFTTGNAVQARWFDPTNAVFTTVAGSPFANTGSRVFTPTGNNAAGNGDWVLLLQGTTGPSLAPVVTPQTVSLSLPVASEPAPVVTGQTVPLQLPKNANDTVAQMSATNTPTASLWSIGTVTPASASTWFNIDKAAPTPGRVFVTAAGATGLNNTTQTINIEVIAANAFGPGRATLIVNAATAAAVSVVTPQTVGLQLPKLANDTVAQMSATNSPIASSWAIGTVSPATANTWFDIDKGGATPGRVFVTAAGATGLDNTTQTISIQVNVANANGPGTSGTLTVNTQSSVGFNDGFTTHPFGTAQWPNLFTSTTGGPQGGLPNGTPHQVYTAGPGLANVRAVGPNWHVPGVDYYVGCPTNIALKTPAQLVANIPGAFFLDPLEIGINNTNQDIVIDGYDLSHCSLLPAYNNDSFGKITIRNCRFSNGDNTGQWDPIRWINNATHGDVLMENCTVVSDGRLVPNGHNAQVDFKLAGGFTFTMRYCYLLNASADTINYDGGSNGNEINVVLQYCLFENGGINPGAHADLGAGTLICNTFLIQNCLTLQNLSIVGAGTQGFGWGCGGADNQFTLNSRVIRGTYDHNCVVLGSYAFSLDGAVTVGKPGQMTAIITNNYFDTSSGNSIIEAKSGNQIAICVGGTYTCTGNINLITGAAFNPNPA